MQLIKTLAKLWLPPIVQGAYHRLNGQKSGFEGPFPNWEAAQLKSAGYDADNILETVKAASLSVQQGEGIAERDGVVFKEPPYPYFVLSGLLRVLPSEEKPLSILDIGGSLGSTYTVCRRFWPQSQLLSWHIVEQKHFVECGCKFFQNQELKFFDSLEGSLAVQKPDIVLLGSVLQYLPEPYALLKEIAQLRVKAVIIDKTPFWLGAGEDCISVQSVPSTVYAASYPAWLLSEQKTRNILSEYYRPLATEVSAEGFDRIKTGKFVFKSMIWEKS